jgi:ketosteroid isomerase-like protein
MKMSQVERDVREINRVMADYCWSLDTRDWERLGRCFLEDVVFEASNMGRYTDRRSLMIAFQTRTIRTPVRRHMITNRYVSVDGDTAEFTSYLQNVRVRFSAPGGDFFIAGGYYRNTLKRTPDGWKISHLRWEATYIEGNKALDPNLPPAPYLSVMSSKKDAPWGGARTAARDVGRGDTQITKDLVIGMFRALDLGDVQEVASALVDDAEMIVNGDRMVTAAALVQALRPEGTRWSDHGFWNEMISLSDIEARYAAYVYRVTNDGAAENTHSGGVLMVTARPTSGGWRVARLEYIGFWTRGSVISSDPVAVMPDYARIPAFIDRIEGERRPLADEDAVAGLMAKYTWSYDYWDFQAVADCFVENVQGVFTTGSTSVFLDRASMVPGIRRGRETQPYMQHYSTNYVVDMGLDGESAEVRAYASTRRTEAGGGPVFVAGGRYDGYARKIGGRWVFLTFQYTRLHGPYDGGVKTVPDAARQ